MPFLTLLRLFCPDQGDWLFLTPWSAIAREANSLETRSQEKIRRYIQKQHKALANLHKNFQVLATTAKKKYSNMVVKVPEGSSSSKVDKGYRPISVDIFSFYIFLCFYVFLYGNMTGIVARYQIFPEGVCILHTNSGMRIKEMQDCAVLIHLLHLTFKKSDI